MHADEVESASNGTSITTQAGQRRKAHTKSRAGCDRCKQRHVRCDEVKPACSQCLRLGQSCPGYQNVIPKRKHAKVKRSCRFINISLGKPQVTSPPAAPVPTTAPLCREPSSPYASMSTDDLHLLDFFIEQTLPLCITSSCNASWARSLLALQAQHTSLQSVCLALASAHRSLYLEETLSSADAAQDRQSALHRHMRALAQFRTALDLSSVPLEVLWLSWLIFYILASLNGHRSEMLVHLRQALRFMSEHRPIPAEERAVRELLWGMGIAQAMYGRPRLGWTPEVQACETDYYESQHVDDTDVTDITGTVESAHPELLAILAENVKFVHDVDEQKLSGVFQITCRQTVMKNRLKEWRHRFEPPFATAVARTGPRTPQEQGMCALLARAEMAHIFLSVYATDEQLQYDKHAADFERVVSLVEDSLTGLDDNSPNNRAFSIGLGLIPALFYTATRCRNPHTRRKAAALLARAPRREGPWDAHTAARIAAAVIALEEDTSGVAATCDENDGGATAHYGIPECNRVQQIDIRGDEQARLAVLLRSPRAGSLLEVWRAMPI